MVVPTDCSDVLTSDSNGPWRDVRIRSDRGCASPRTEISSVRISSGVVRVATSDQVAVDLLEVEILNVQIARGQTPGNPGVLADHHPGH